MDELNMLNIKGVNCYEVGGTAYLKLEDVARGLGFTQEKNGVQYVKWERVIGYLHELNFSPQVGKDSYIPENIFYRLAMKAKNEVAERFQALVADEIIPSIRRNGAYMTENTIKRALEDPDFLIELATNLKVEKERNKMLQIENQRMKPKEIFADAVSESETSILVGEMAKLIRQNGVDIGQRRLFAWLRENGYLIKRNGSDYNMPTQKSMDMGLFEIRVSAVNKPDGSTIETKTPKVTGRGQIYFVNKFVSAFNR